MMDNAGIRLLLLIGPGNIDEVHHGLAFAVHPCPGKCEIGPLAVLQSQDILIEPNRIGELSRPNIEMIEHAYAHAMSLPVYEILIAKRSS